MALQATVHYYWTLGGTHSREDTYNVGLRRLTGSVALATNQSLGNSAIAVIRILLLFLIILHLHCTTRHAGASASASGGFSTSRDGAALIWRSLASASIQNSIVQYNIECVFRRFHFRFSSRMAG